LNADRAPQLKPSVRRHELMRYLETEGMWLLSAPEDQSFEVLVAGDRSAPDAARLSIVEKTIPVLDGLVVRATAYFDEFVERAKFAEGNGWYFEGLESGRVAAEPENQLILHFSIEGDTYGLWSVSFQVSGSQYYPVAFFRRQI
jgi:hypothetical protein